MKKHFTLAALAAATLAAGPLYAQTSTSTQQQPSQRDRIGSILGTLFGDRAGATTTIDAQWAAGRTPLADQRIQFESRVNTDMRSGALSQATGSRLKYDYAALVQLENRYGADGRFTTQERTELADRYGDLTQVLATGDAGGGFGTSGTGGSATAVVADGQAEFSRRVDSAVLARRITRVQATRLKADYAATVQVEAGYLSDRMISDNEQDDLDSRLDALDARLDGSVALPAPPTPRLRLDAVLRALPTSGLTAATQAQLRVEQGDLSRLEAAYGKFSASADDRAYLERRLTDLETRARVRR